MNSTINAWGAACPGEIPCPPELRALKRRLEELTRINGDLLEQRQAARGTAEVRILEARVQKKYASDLRRVVADETYCRDETARVAQLTLEVAAREPVVERAEAELVRVAALHDDTKLSVAASCAVSQEELQGEIEKLEWELRYKEDELKTKKRELAVVNNGLELETLERALVETAGLPQDMSYGEIWSSSNAYGRVRQKLSACPQKERERLNRRDGYYSRFRSRHARPGCSLEATQYLSMGNRVETYKTSHFADTARSDWLWDIDN